MTCARHLRLALILSVTLTTVFGPRSASAQKRLRWTLEPGETVKVQFSQVMDTEASIQSAVLQSTVQMSMAMKWHVLNVDAEGTAEMAQSIEQLKIVMNSPGAGEVSYDSSAPQQPDGLAKDLASGIEPLIGMRFIQKMNDRGEILDVRLSDEASAALDKSPLGSQLKEVFSREGLDALVNQTAAVLPQHPVRPGDTWTGTSETKSPVGALKMDLTYTYLGTETRQGRELEKIGVKIQLGFAEGANPLGLNVKFTDQNNSGLMYFDARAGRFVETTVNQKMTMETAIGDRTHQQKLNTRLSMRFSSDRTNSVSSRQSPSPRNSGVARRTTPAPRR
jgi:hypothetical protein